MRNKKGQALVEFIIILPVIIYLLLVVIDFGIIMYQKNNLESKMEDVISMYHDNESKEEIEKFLNKNNQKITYEVVSDSKYITLKVKKEQDLIAPGLQTILGKPFYIRVERVILNG